MSRILSPVLVAMSLISAGPAAAVGVVVDIPTLTFPTADTVDTTRGCASLATVTVCTPNQADN